MLNFLQEIVFDIIHQSKMPSSAFGWLNSSLDRGRKQCI